VRTLANTDPDTLSDPAALRNAFVATANGTKGVTGTVELDAAGDRVSAPYTFWSICAGPRGNARWVDTGRWTPAADPTGPGKVEAKSCPKA
jgi:ABC-type branched-subunit amino acid transport system substrate-binding protein